MIPIDPPIPPVKQTSNADSNESDDSDSEGIARSDKESGDPTSVKSGTVLRCSVCATHHPERLELLELRA